MSGFRVAAAKWQDRTFGGRFHGMLRFLIPLVFAAVLPLSAETKLLDRENLVAWCIVPFDAKKRGPEERAAMLKELGLSRLAYDWRDEHVASLSTTATHTSDGSRSSSMR